MKFYFVLLIAIFPLTSIALDHAACSRLLNNGLYKKYEYGGIDQPLTKATKRHGSSKGTSATSTEGTTALLDPKYWSNVSTSETQSTSSTGECNLFGLNQLKEQRELYFSQNRDELIADIAKGYGEHLQILASYSLCDEDKYHLFNNKLQERTGYFIRAENGYGELIDQTVAQSSDLSGVCHIYQ